MLEEYLTAQEGVGFRVVKCRWHSPRGLSEGGKKGVLLEKSELRANKSFRHSLVFLWYSRGNLQRLSHVICVSLYDFIYSSAVSGCSRQGRVRAVLLHKVDRTVKAQRSGLSPHRTAAITLNHPSPPPHTFILLLSLWPPLASTDPENIWWVQATKSDAGLCFACKQQKYWANYEIIIWC